MPDIGPCLGFCLELLLAVDVKLCGAGHAWWWLRWLANPLALFGRVGKGVVHPVVEMVGGVLLRLVSDELYGGGDDLLCCVTPGQCWEELCQA